MKPYGHMIRWILRTTEMNNNSNAILSYKILQHNIRSLRSNKDEMDAFIAYENIDVVLISETWSTHNDIFSFRGYEIYLKHSKSIGYRGVGILGSEKWFANKKK